MARTQELVAAGTEKLTINLGIVDLGQIDLLVQEGFYSNRSDLIRTAVRNQVTLHAEAIKRTVDRHALHLGLQDISRAELERAKAAGEMLHLRVVGLVRIAADVTPALARATIGSITVLGTLQATVSIRKALAERLNSH